VRILFGQESPERVMELMRAGRPGVLDVPVEALLAPFATARTPHRLWGDALLDPVGTALVAVGLVLCARRVGRSRASAAILGVLAVGLATGATSSGDAVSHTRLAPSLIPLAVLAGIGFESIRLALAPTRSSMAVSALLVAATASAGAVTFARVNPTILPASWLGISFEALGTRPPGAEAVFLEPGVSWLHVPRIAGLLPSRPCAAQTWAEFSAGAPAQAPDRVYFWSPSLERDESVAREICSRWPRATLYTLTDEPGLFQALAAVPRGDGWEPRLPTGRWTRASCAAPAGAQTAPAS